MRAFVAGVPGVGKSTALATIQSAPVVKFGELMLDAARARGFSGTRDDLRALDEADLREYRVAAMQKLPSSFVIDGHLVIENAGAFRLAAPTEFFVQGFLTVIVVLEAMPSAVGTRRQSRPDRYSGHPRFVEEHQRQQAIEAQRLAAATGARLHRIDLTGTSPAEAGLLLVETINSNGAT